MTRGVAIPFLASGIFSMLAGGLISLSISSKEAAPFVLLLATVTAAVLVASALGLWKGLDWGWWMGIVGGLGNVPALYFVGTVSGELLNYGVISNSVSIPVGFLFSSGMIMIGASSIYLILRRRSFGEVTTLNRLVLAGSVALALTPLALSITLYYLSVWNCHTSSLLFHHCHPFFDAWHIH